MSLVAIAAPETESELSVMLCLLKANDIPVFVQGQHFGGLFPGPQISSYNARRILVPHGCSAEAQALLAAFASPPEELQQRPPTPISAKLRMLAEFFLLGWFVPAHRPNKYSSQSHDNNT